MIGKLFPPELGEVDGDVLSRLPVEETVPPFSYEGCNNLKEWYNGRWNRKEMSK
jgi:hypothetical protein